MVKYLEGALAQERVDWLTQSDDLDGILVEVLEVTSCDETYEISITGTFNYDGTLCEEQWWGHEADGHNEWECLYSEVEDDEYEWEPVVFLLTSSWEDDVND